MAGVVCWFARLFVGDFPNDTDGLFASTWESRSFPFEAGNIHDRTGMFFDPLTSLITGRQGGTIS